MDDWEGEFPFGEILAETFVLGVFGAGKVHVVVSDLEEETYRVDQRYEVPIRLVSQRTLNEWGGRSTFRCCFPPASAALPV